MEWAKQRVLVTGAGGFIGSHLTERLLALGASVRALVHYRGSGSAGWLDPIPAHPNLERIPGDICDAGLVRESMRGCTIVYHLAALIAIPYSYRAPGSYVRTNIEGTLNVLEAARELRPDRVVHTSTSEVYGTARYVPIDEQHPLQGQSPYSATKIAADKLVEAYHRSYDVPAVTIRPFNTFGPRQSTRAVIPTIMAQCLTRSTVQLGNLDATRDLNFVANTVDGFVAGAESQAARGETIQLGSGAEITIGELAERIIRMSGRNVKIESDPQRRRPDASEVQRLIADNRKAETLLGWRPRIDLDEGLRVTLNWVGENLERCQANDYHV
jgi:dTDP-glucose 4,6-dehydratase